MVERDHGGLRMPFGDAIEQKVAGKAAGEVDAEALENMRADAALPVPPIGRTPLATTQIDAAMGMLGAKTWKPREDASGTLRQGDGNVVPHLDRALSSRDAEVQARASSLLLQRVNQYREPVEGLFRTFPQLKDRLEKDGDRGSGGVLFHDFVKELEQFRRITPADAQAQTLELGNLKQAASTGNLGKQSAERGPLNSSFPDSGEFLAYVDAHTEAIKDVPGQIAGLRTIATRAEGVRPEDFKTLSTFPNLENLTLQWRGEDPTAHVPSALGEMQNLKHLDLTGFNLSDADLETIAKLKNLEFLSVGGNGEITNAGISHIANMSNLKGLDLMGTGVRAEGLNRLDPLAVSKLEELRLSYSADIDDAACAAVSKFSSLKSLELRGTSITDTGLAHLKDLEHLEYLAAGQTAITDDGAAAFVSLHPNLKALDLDGTKSGDRTVEALSKLKHVEHLDLNGTKVTDKGALEHLAKMTGLKTLRISQTEISPEVHAHLQNALPNCEIEYSS